MSSRPQRLYIVVIMKNHLLTTLCLALSGVVDNNVPDWVEVIPSGKVVQGLDGRSWLNDKPDGIVQQFLDLKNSGRDLVFDFEHSTELKAPNGDKAPASGWGIDMQQRHDSSIWVKVDWTEEGKEAVSKREYRYLSPVLIYEKSTNRIVGIQSVALTNKANLLVTALNQTINQTINQTNETEKPMDLKALFALLGLPDTATLDDALTAIKALQREKETAMNHAKHPPLDKFVPRADYDTAMNQLGTIKAELDNIKKSSLQSEIDTAINAALTAGKIVPATKDYHVAMCQQEGGLDRFKTYVESAPVIAGDSHITGKPSETDIALNAETQKISELFGNSVADLKKYGAI